MPDKIWYNSSDLDSKDEKKRKKSRRKDDSSGEIRGNRDFPENSYAEEDSEDLEDRTTKAKVYSEDEHGALRKQLRKKSKRSNTIPATNAPVPKTIARVDTDGTRVERYPAQAHLAKQKEEKT